eukprot:jgi/Ulvmu1/905/UM101_0013.1
MMERCTSVPVRHHAWISALGHIVRYVPVSGKVHSTMGRRQLMRVDLTFVKRRFQLVEVCIPVQCRLAMCTDCEFIACCNIQAEVDGRDMHCVQQQGLQRYFPSMRLD